MDEFVGIDFAVVVGVEPGEVALGVHLHLFGRQEAVMVAVGLAEPCGRACHRRGARADRLAHRADEGAAAPSGDEGRRGCGRRLSSGCEKRQEQQWASRSLSSGKSGVTLRG